MQFVEAVYCFRLRLDELHTIVCAYGNVFVLYYWRVEIYGLKSLFTFITNHLLHLYDSRGVRTERTINT